MSLDGALSVSLELAISIVLGVPRSWCSKISKPSESTSMRCGSSDRETFEGEGSSKDMSLGRLNRIARGVVGVLGTSQRAWWP